MQMRWWMLLSVMLGIAAPAVAGAEDINAGPIWNQADAANKCPTVCKAPMHWNGNWKTTVPNKMSVCGCDHPPPPPPPPPANSGKRAVEAGPIWNQGDAQAKCPHVCKAPETWDGQWWTTVPNRMSVCECASAPPPVAHDVEAGPIWNQADATNKCPRVCRAPEKWNGQWRTTVPNKMSVCGCSR